MKKMILAVVLIGLLGFISSLSAEVVVPNVIGMDYGQAVQALQKAGLKIGNSAYVSTPKKELHLKIASQGPPGGTKLSSPQPVNLTVYRMETVAVPNVVPDVIGMDVNQAVQALQKAGLKPGNIAYVNTPQPELGNKIAGQGPPGGTKLSSPQPVNLTVYRFQAESVAVPNVVGMDYPRAMNTFIAAGFNPKRRDRNTNVPQENEKVFGQGIAAGQKVPKGTVIELIVNKLVVPQVTVPDVTRISLGEAQIKLLESGLTAQLSPQANPTSDPKLNGKVSSQNPQAGNPVSKGSGVKLTLFVSQVVEPPSATVIVPEVIRMSMAEATAKLSAAGLKSEVVPPQTSTPDPNLHSKISSQNPRSGSQVPRGSIVKFNIFVHMPEDPNKVKVPKVVGMLAPDAFKTIRDAGLYEYWDSPVQSPGDKNQTGRIISQNPQPGQQVGKGSSVTVVIWVFPLKQPTFEQIAHKHFSEVERLAREGGFDDITYHYHLTKDKSLDGKVLGHQYPVDWMHTKRRAIYDVYKYEGP